MAKPSSYVGDGLDEMKFIILFISIHFHIKAAMLPIPLLCNIPNYVKQIR